MTVQHAELEMAEIFSHFDVLFTTSCFMLSHNPLLLCIGSSESAELLVSQCFQPVW